ncbi:ArnT family glycosyltransferase [Hymenobacter psychrotolerans]|uniref:Dolichyl-phosphate-mannose-protein mannosyltransferase n=1 Tax=Hymenobacter psychrotolerans DSM 18569 TaxID=1121959 RepID=A0A1M6PY63_9BACT|nr:glycosyltransferase family 39 protein [Hymenobacter psychrotolerans]SHK12841.1 Dolichyl-phosphate-mannose-protein mannosyltransferase [Hymenobacter psychrotolerans DSM 18569]
MLARAKRQNWLVRMFFGLLLLAGLLLFRDYGVSVDEPTDHHNGAINAKYVAEQLFPALLPADADLRRIPPLASNKNNDHGVLFELPVAGLGRLLADGQPGHYFLLRHLCVFLTFVGGTWALYRLAWLQFGHRLAGLLAAALLVFSPRFFAEAFFNGKDIVFMAFFTLAMYTLARLLQRPTLWWALVHGLATAAAIGLRLPAFIIVAFTVAGVGLLAAFPGPNDTIPTRRLARMLAVYGCATVLGTIACWPYLWEAPLAHFLEAYQSLSRYGWPFSTLYLGQFVPAAQLPWHYVPVWMLITTPLPYVLAAVLGVGASVRQILRQRFSMARTLPGRLHLLTLGWLLGPVLMVIVLRSTLYDGWRHLYFVYPALLLLAVRGLLLLGRAAAQPRQWVRHLATALLLLLGGETLRTVARIVQLHPYQHLYFSFLPARVAEQQFERDYWGLAFRQGLDWVLAHDPAPQVTVASDVPDMVYANAFLLSASDQARLRRVPAAQSAPPARYFLANYRWHPQPYPDSLGTEVYTIRAGGIKILSVFRRP